MSFDPATTPDRGLYLEIDTPDVRLGQAIFRVNRPADRIAPVERPGFPSSTEVRRFTGYCWGLKPVLTDFTNAVTETNFNAGFLLEGFMLDIAGVNVPGSPNSIVQHYAFKSPGDLPGIGTIDTLRPRGMPVWRRVVPAGETWNRQLTLDVNVVPKPAAPTQAVPMDRLMVGRQTYPPNQGWVIGFFCNPLAGSVQDNLLTFYYGGSSDIEPGPSVNAGYWALTIRGSGDAILYEQKGGTWEQRDAFKWSNLPKPPSGWVTIEIVPYGTGNMFFRSSAIATDPTEGGKYFAQGAFRSSKKDFLAHLFQHAEIKCGHKHLRNIAGAGNIRFDFRRDWRFSAYAGVQVYPDGADLYDEPFQIPDVPGGTALTVEHRSDIPAGTDIQITLYDATTHAELDFDADRPDAEGGPCYRSNAGQRFYYAGIRFSSPDKLRTPLLFDYTATAEGFLSFTQPTPVSARVLDAQLTGADYNSPDHEMGTLEVEDYTNALATLKDRSRVRARVCTECTWPDIDTGEPIPTFSVLQDGEIAHAPSSPIVHPKDHLWPVAQASHYGITCVGMWARIWDLELPADEPLVGNDGNPLTVSELLKGLFFRAGFTEHFVDLPETNYRLQLSKDKDKSIIPSGTVIGEQIMSYAALYTDLLVFWDGNAKKDPDETMDGLWRGIYYPELPFNFVWNFTQYAPDAGLSHLPQSYPENTYFIEHCHDWVQPPELNHLILLGGSDGTDTGYKFEVEYRNRRSYRGRQSEPEPATNHPDYIGHEVLRRWRLVELSTPEALQYVGRRLFKETAFGYPRRDFDAPLVLIWPVDEPYLVRPRPLRLGDMVQMDGRPFMITCCNPKVGRGRGDRCQMAYYEGIYRDSFVGPQQVWEEEVEED